MGYKLNSTIEIQASPAVVRATLLDFPSYKNWSEWSITNQKDVTASGAKAQSGDTLSVVMPFGSFSPTVQDNKPELFAWLGSLPYIFTGRHEFGFNESKTTPGGTTFTQFEEFTGLASFLMAEGWSMRKNSAATWEKFDQDLKAEAEKRASS
ncbi:hypothetical protein LIA77_06116 [Sarocladium implicatum]|nr:hypothetical protein LIA77_06116 [Sarocladium implicatum]